MESKHTLSDFNWDLGSAYDFLISLQVLHRPERFGLRPSWAAGVRSRLAPSARSCLETVHTFFRPPFHWLYNLPQPKDATSVLTALHSLVPAERPQTLFLSQDKDEQGIRQVLEGITSRGAWTSADIEHLRDALRQSGREPRPVQTLERVLDLWAHPAEFGEQYLAGLQSYYEVFYVDEEKRLLPHLRDGLQRAQAAAGEMPLPELLAYLSQGVHFDPLLKVRNITLAPSYWGTPLVFIADLAPDHTIFLFGVRPPDVSLVPGETVPDALLLALKALADPTRLRILHDLTQEPQTPSQIARRLRLRAPTVTHHLNALRLAGLVHLLLADEGERRYTARLENVQGLFESLRTFLEDKPA